MTLLHPTLCIAFLQVSGGYNTNVIHRKTPPRPRCFLFRKETRLLWKLQSSKVLSSAQRFFGKAGRTRWGGDVFFLEVSEVGSGKIIGEIYFVLVYMVYNIIKKIIYIMLTILENHGSSSIFSCVQPSKPKKEKKDAEKPRPNLDWISQAFRSPFFAMMGCVSWLQVS